MSAWEIALLVDVGRIELAARVTDWVKAFVSRPGVQEVPLTARAAANAYALDGLAHSDPTDRLLIATSIDLSLPLVTYDARILDFARDHGSAVGFQALSDAMA